MQLLYNNRLLQETELRMPLTNRAFQYNDGFFETIIIRQGRLSFWEDHVQRMQEAAVSLQLSLPPYLTSPAFPEKLLDLAKQQQAMEHGRLKLKFWRSGAGIYTPETNEADWLATVKQTTPVPILPLQVGLCRQVRTQYSSLSHFKGPNAPLYVVASIEKDTRNMNDMLLLDLQNRVAEFISSNVFWIRDNKVYTPALETGCVNGVLRRNIMRWCRQNDIVVAEVLADVDHLYHADGVISANVTGIKRIASIEEISLPTQHPLIEKLYKGLFE
ncbi:aminotransferase class IV [Pontibacter pamirensis]|uniref:aminotransferase class IV n=1 Tax=Pontibacter pamirensis TaxID=2562824 RepID=UPI001389ADB2|nr:aminotransferase class IV [Pontibacter pamirensis]